MSNLYGISHLEFIITLLYRVCTFTKYSDFNKSSRTYAQTSAPPTYASSYRPQATSTIPATTFNAQPILPQVSALMEQNRTLQAHIGYLTQALSNFGIPIGSMSQYQGVPYSNQVRPEQNQTGSFPGQAIQSSNNQSQPYTTGFQPQRTQTQHSPSVPSASATARACSDNPNVHHHINVLLKNKESKYSGSDEEHLQDFMDAYASAAEDYQLTPREKLQYFHNLFRGDALSFYNMNVKNRYSSFEEAVRVIYGHFNSPDVQQRVKTDMSTLSLTKFADKEGSIPKGLSALATYIANRTPQCPPCFRTEANKVDFLKQAVLDQSWAKEILVRINPGTQFQSLYTELANALQLHQEVQQRTGFPNSRAGTSSKATKPFIYFTQPKVVKSLANAMFPGNDNASSCWNCGRKGHRFTKCHKDLDLARIAAAKSEYFAKKSNSKKGMKRVLYELVNGLNDLCNVQEDTCSDEVAKAFFGDLMDDSESEVSSSSEDEADEEIPKESLFAGVQSGSPTNEPDSEQDF